MAKRKDYVEISSTKTIMVTCGLQYEDVTNKDAHIPDRLKVLEKWSKFNILIREGKGVYPSAILEWQTVKALEKDGILTIGHEVEEAGEKEQELKSLVDEMKTDIKVEDVNLEELAAEESK